MTLCSETLSMKRPLEKQASSKDAQPDEKRQKMPALASVIVEAVKMDSLQKLCSTLEPLLRRVVGEEVERAFAKLGPSKAGLRASPKRIQGPDDRALRLQFRNRLALPLFTGSKVEGEQGSAIHVVLQDATSGQVVTTGPEASAKLDIIVLEGDFSADDEEDWTQEDFEAHEVRERDGKRPLLTGELSVTLKEGVGTLGELTFTDNSSWIRSRKFRLGVRIASGFCEGIRIREGKTESFTVKDHRGELYKKHYPPALSDEVWRLDKIGKDGAFHKRLNTSGVNTVEDFLRLVVMDPQKLRNILGNGMSNKMWEGTVEHAKTCVLSGKLHVYYADEQHNIGVIFNNIFQLMGLIADGQYVSVDSLSDSEKVYVDKLVKVAYENWENVVEYDGEALVNTKPYKLRGMNTHTEDPVPSGNRSVQSTRMLNPTPIATSHTMMQRSAAAPSVNAMAGPAVQAYTTDLKAQAMVDRYRGESNLIDQGSNGAMFGSDFQESSNSLSEENIPDRNLAITGLALGPPQSSDASSEIPYQPFSPFMPSTDASNLWSRFREREPLNGQDSFSRINIFGRNSQVEDYSEEEIRMRSAEILENEDMNLQMQHLLRMFNASAGDQTPAYTNDQEDDSFPFQGSFPPSPDMSINRGSSSSARAKANVSWLKLKAALRWGIFIRKRAAARKAKLEQLDE